MWSKWISYFVFSSVVILAGLVFPLPALAQTCGGTVKCKCGDSVIASRTIQGDPVVKSVCPGTALFMSTPNVTLIIKNGGLVGSLDVHSQWATGDGINISADNVTVRKGKIEGFQHGIFGITNGSTISGVTTEHNAVNGINISGNGNTIEASAGSHNTSSLAQDGILITGDDNVVTDNYAEKSVSGFVGIRVVGSGNFLQDNFTKLNDGGGVQVTGDGVIDGDNIDGGGNKAGKTAGTPKCEIDGNPCLP